MNNETAEYTEIAGMRYRRLPAEGEMITVEAWDDLGGMCICRVMIGREIIAWDQIEVPTKQKWRENAYKKRERMAYAAASHWQGLGFTVDLATIGTEF